MKKLYPVFFAAFFVAHTGYGMQTVYEKPGIITYFANCSKQNLEKQLLERNDNAESHRKIQNKSNEINKRKNNLKELVKQLDSCGLDTILKVEIYEKYIETHTKLITLYKAIIILQQKDNSQTKKLLVELLKHQEDPLCLKAKTCLSNILRLWDERSREQKGFWF